MTERLVVALDPDLGVSAVQLAAAWDADKESRSVGAANVDAAVRGVFLPDPVTLVVIPLAVNVASTAACAMVGRLVARLRAAPPDQVEVEVEVAEVPGSDGDRVVVVRLSRARK